MHNNKTSSRPEGLDFWDNLEMDFSDSGDWGAVSGDNPLWQFADVVNPAEQIRAALNNLRADLINMQFPFVPATPPELDIYTAARGDKNIMEMAQFFVNGINRHFWGLGRSGAPDAGDGDVPADIMRYCHLYGWLARRTAADTVITKLFYLRFAANPDAPQPENKYTDGTGLPADFAREFLRRLDVDVENLNHYDNDHGTYLWAAVQDENYVMAAILIIAGADVNTVDPDGGTETAIHTAAEGDLKMVKLLVAAGADLTARCHAYNYTPLETARYKVKNEKIAAYLESVQNPHYYK